jgi:4-hydroxybenzoate polyprenyltransferase
LALGAAVVLYDAWHKANPLAPLVMGACRGLTCLTGALAVGALRSGALVGAGTLAAYVVGLSLVARQERRTLRLPLALALMAVPFGVGLMRFSPVALLPLVGLAVLVQIAARRAGDRARFGQAIALLISGISLVDGILIAGTGSWLALVGFAGCAATLAGQRWVRGT